MGLKVYSVIGALLAGSLTIAATESRAGWFSEGPHMINVDSSRKAAQVYLPKGYEGQKEWPLVVLLHGYSATGTLQDIYFGLSLRVSAKGFILLIPEGTANSKGDQYWNATDTCCDFEKSGVDDAGYLVSLINESKNLYNVDPERVYLLGHSNGGFMTQRLICDHAHLFAAAVGLNSSSFANEALCKPSQPVSVLQIHAEDDPTIHFSGADTGDFLYPGVSATVQRWVQTNQCVGTPVEAGPFDLIYSIPGNDTTTQTWSQCLDGTEVAQWTIKAHSSRFHKPHIPLLSIDITNRILDFLLGHKKS